MAEQDYDEIDLLELWGFLWSGKLRILGVALLFAVASTATVLMLPSWYQSSVTLTPAGDNGAAAGLGGSLGGLASLAGVNINGGDPSVEAIATLQSRDLAREFIEQNDLLEVLLVDEIDPETGQWKERDPNEQPDIRDAVEYFRENVRSVSQDRQTNIVQLAVEWTDPALAAQWANELVAMLNERMRARAAAEAEANIAYLQEALNQTSELALQQSIARLLETELQNLMMARGNRDFAFRVIDAAEVPKERSWPRRSISVILTTILGCFLGAFWVVLRGMIARESRTGH